MLEEKHWLSGSNFLFLFHEAIHSVEYDISDRLINRGELERPEPTITTILIENLQNRLELVKKHLRDLQGFPPNQPTVSQFDFTVCDMQAGNRDVLGADLAFIFRTQWPDEFTTRRGILLQAKRIRPPSTRTIRRLDQEIRHVYGLSLNDLEQICVLMNPSLSTPSIRRMRLPFILNALTPIKDDLILGDFLIDIRQLDLLVSQVVSSYYLFYDYPIPHMSLPCVQSLTIRGLVEGARGSNISRSSVLMHAMPLTKLLVQEFVGCRVGEWNSSFSQLERIADQNRVGSIETQQGDFNVHAYNVSYVVMMDITLIPSPNDIKDE